MKLSAKEWKPFMFTDVFIIRKGFYNKHPLFSESDPVPFIGATEANNGITGMTTWEKIEESSKIGYGPNEPMSSKKFPGKCICVTNNGSVGFAYYQATDFTCSHDVNPLYLKDRELNRPLAMFLISCIEKQRVCFEYARKWRPKRMVNSRIMLPVNEAGLPDYTFMESYMKDVENRILDRASNYSHLITDKSVKIREKKWDVFYLSEQSGGIFKISATKSGIDRNKVLVSNESYPYITRSEYNNGWSGFVSKQEVGAEDSGNVITLGLDTQTAFYQPIPFYTGQNIQVVSHDKLNRYVALFLIPLILFQMKSKFNWGGYGATLGRLHKMKIKLPVTDSGEPDFQFMENYMKNIEAQKIKAYLDYKQSE